MARGTPIYTNFLMGEVSPLTDGRLDHKAYFSSLTTLKNMIVLAQGPATKRPGTRFIASAKNSSVPCRLIRFNYGAGQNYILEFGHLYIRFYTAGGQLMSGGSPYEIVSPYDSEDLGAIKYRQVADVVYLTHPLYPTQKLTRLGPTSWTITAAPFVWGPFLEENDTATTITPSAATGNGITLTASQAIFYELHEGSVWKLTSSKIVSANLDAADEYTAAITLNAGETFIVSLGGTWVGEIHLQRFYDGGAEWIPYIAYTGNATQELVNLEDNTQYRLYMTVHTSGTANVRISVPDFSGYVLITDVTAGGPQTTATANVIETLYGTHATSKWSEGAFSALRGYPADLRFYEGRLLLAGTLTRPSTIWGSKVDDYENFQTGTTAEHGYSYTLAGSTVNRIRWMVDSRVLQVGTEGDEWKFGFIDEPTTYDNVDAKKESEHGSEDIQALLIGNSVIYVESGGHAIRRIAYSFAEDAFKSPRISDHAEHLLTPGIYDMDFAAQPDPILWLVMADGSLRSCTLDLDEGLAAYSQHDLDGLVESVAVIRGEKRDEVWFSVVRTVNGVSVRYIEQLQTTQWTDQNLAFYCDSALPYDGASTQTLSGLDHLIGETVKVLANGAAHADCVVNSSGEITLDYPVTKAVVGLGFQANLKTRRLEMASGAGTSQGKKKAIFEMTLRLWRTTSCKAGYDENHLDEIVFRTTETPLGSPPALFSGDKRLAMPNRGTDDGYIVAASDEPMPLTVCAIIPTAYTTEL